MNTMMAAQPPVRSRNSQPGEESIAQYIASSESIDQLVADGYLVRHDGRLIARQLRAPQLRQALTHSMCHTARPDVDDFYQADGESDTDWSRRRAGTVRSNCSACPVRAACAELALRDDDTEGLRGGLTPEKLRTRLQAEAAGLDQARAEDQRAAREQQARIAAAVEVQHLARQYLGGSIPPKKREANHAAIATAARRRDELFATHRLATGWTQAA
ncbi:WhiB family transcriptional regulator [Streptomyces sp. NPDC001407]|uniref:WhiB family transcriptional regulator n=1 Tax=Streptomyces sp. NPDC001407 TaxID=3364573 RepID=UPI00368A0BA6